MKQKLRILVVEDEAAIRSGLIDVLVYHGYDVDGSADGRDGLAKSLGGRYDLIILDVMLPGVSGFDICDAIRRRDRDQPIIMLTAKVADDDIVRGLSLGADDYVAKPFSIAALVLRIEAVLRRSRALVELAAHIRLGDDIEIDTRNLSGRRGSQALAFTRREMDVLQYLYANASRPVARDELLVQVWGYAKLSAFPVDGPIPGLVSYFQIDADGAFTTPLLPVGVDPTAYGIAADEVAQRRAVETRVHALLSVHDSIADERRDVPDKTAGGEKKRPAQRDGQAVFDRLSESEAPALLAAQSSQTTGAFGRVDDLKFDSKLEVQARESDRQSPAAVVKASVEEPRVARKEQAAVPVITVAQAAGTAVNSASAAANAATPGQPRIRTFDGELDPFVFNRLDADHFVLFRKVWLNGQRLTQGAVIGQKALLDGLIEAPFLETALSRMSDLTMAYRGDVIGVSGASSRPGYTVSQMTGELLYRAPLSAPLNDLELIFSIADLPVGPGARIVGWATLVLACVLIGGFVVVYRFAAAQIDLTRKQQDFVAAVSHELKTPLTSIRMYGEILAAGWASEEKKRAYYDFIVRESERLSRLIANILRLARLTRNGEPLEVKAATASELLSLVESMVASQVEQAGFRLDMARDSASDAARIAVDADSLVQILINLVDNALKFSAHAPRKVVEIGYRSTADSVAFRVRDYGPGVAPQHLKRIFELFYRGEDELTRETTGTGIGLALVAELTAAMGGSVGVRNCEPGAEFTVTFPKNTSG